MFSIFNVQNVVQILALQQQTLGTSQQYTAEVLHGALCGTCLTHWMLSDVSMLAAPSSDLTSKPDSCSSPNLDLFRTLVSHIMMEQYCAAFFLGSSWAVLSACKQSNCMLDMTQAWCSYKPLSHLGHKQITLKFCRQNHCRPSAIWRAHL